MLTISYDHLWALLKRRGLQPVDLTRACGLSSSTIRQLQKGEDVSLSTLRKVCEGLNCRLSDVAEFVVRRL